MRRWWSRAGLRVTAAMALLITVAGCTQNGSTAGGADAVSPSPTPLVSAGADQFQNPVLAEDLPDPAVLEAEGNFYLYGTQGSDANIQLRSSADLVDWEQLPDALPTLGTWAAVGKTWAPEVIAVNKGYVMFYTASDKASGKQCIGRAVAAGPRGPFTDSSTKPLVCQQELGGSIDASPQRDGDGTVYLYWKNDGNCCGLPVTLWGQEMDAAASKFVGRPTALLSNTQDWQGTLI